MTISSVLLAITRERGLEYLHRSQAEARYCVAMDTLTSNSGTASVIPDGEFRKTMSWFPDAHNGLVRSLQKPTVSRVPVTPTPASASATPATRALAATPPSKASATPPALSEATAAPPPDNASVTTAPTGATRVPPVTHSSSPPTKPVKTEVPGPREKVAPAPTVAARDSGPAVSVKSTPVLSLSSMEESAEMVNAFTQAHSVLSRHLFSSDPHAVALKSHKTSTASTEDPAVNTLPLNKRSASSPISPNPSATLSTNAVALLILSPILLLSSRTDLVCVRSPLPRLIASTLAVTTLP